MTTIPSLQPPYSLALGHAWLWAKACEVPAARLLGDGFGLPDALLLLVALRNVRRAAELAGKSLTKPEAQQHLADALSKFDAALPGLKEARDVIEHLDEYAIGVGTEQKKLQAATPSLTTAELAARYALRLEGTYNEPIVRVGPHSIEAIKVPGAAGWLFEGIRAAVYAEQGHKSL
ncbi:hypothetical protein FB565_007906 [Actinoplanes lutulentus]|uniref:hypothetical protein n=1 Tax=Actinoplanes lutulentus TaxID=1287878 RepID=UPI0011B948BC|nr:hypothetical protein [Actinoplanes lutulentus]MBB2948135.1 hypothetical protein [Actinoplanes lutulentus]